MVVYGFKVQSVGFNFSPDRNEVLSHLRQEIKAKGHGLASDWESMTFPEKCKKVQETFGYNTLHIDAVRGAHLFAE